MATLQLLAQARHGRACGVPRGAPECLGDGHLRHGASTGQPQDSRPRFGNGCFTVVRTSNSEVGLFSDGRLSRLPPLNPVANLPRVFAGRCFGMPAWERAVFLDTTSVTGFKPENASVALYRSARMRYA